MICGILSFFGIGAMFIPSTISAEELKEADSMVLITVDVFNYHQDTAFEALHSAGHFIENYANGVLNLNSFWLQYIAMRNLRGDKIVIVNGFLDPSHQHFWEKTELWNTDLKLSYFSVVINLT